MASCPVVQTRRLRSCAEARSISENATTSISSTVAVCAYWKLRITSHSTMPMPPAPTMPTTEAELFDRLAQPLAPFVYALVVFLFVGDPRMHRQGRMAGIVAAAVAVGSIIDHARSPREARR